MTGGPISCHHRFEWIHHHRFNDGTALPLAISLVSLSNSCVLILPSNYCTPFPPMTPSSPKLEILWPRFPILDARLCQMESFWWRLCSFFSFLVFLCACGHLSKLQFWAHEYADRRRKQCSACTIFLLCRSRRIACTRSHCQNRFWSIAGNDIYIYIILKTLPECAWKLSRTLGGQFQRT